MILNHMMSDTDSDTGRLLLAGFQATAPAAPSGFFSQPLLLTQQVFIWTITLLPTCLAEAKEAKSRKGNSQQVPQLNTSIITQEAKSSPRVGPLLLVYACIYF